jgi:glycine/D-amino acid oxidase-like deaminating enzyme
MKDNCKVIKVSRDIFCVEIHTQCSNGLTSAVRNGEIIRARKCVFTTGSWTKKVLMENLCIDLPLTPEQTTIAYWKVDHPEEYSSKKFPLFINYDEPLMYGTPAHEYPNMIKCAVHYGKTVDPDHRDFEPAMEGLIQEAAPFLQKYFKGVHATPVMTESCTTSVSDVTYLCTIHNSSNVFY